MTRMNLCLWRNPGKAPSGKVRVLGSAATRRHPPHCHCNKTIIAAPMLFPSNKDVLQNRSLRYHHYRHGQYSSRLAIHFIAADFPQTLIDTFWCWLQTNDNSFMSSFNSRVISYHGNDRCQSRSR